MVCCSVVRSVRKTFWGLVIRFSIGLNKSDVSQLYNFSFTDPYYTVDGVSRGFDVFYRKYDYKDSDISSYAADTYGGNVRFGYPISETQSLSFSAGIDGTKITTGNSTPLVIEDFVKEAGDRFTNYKATLGWSQSELNRGLLPTRGHSQSISSTVSVPGSDATFYKFLYRGQYFQPLTEDFTLRFATRLGYSGAYGNSSEVPFFENFYAGGFGSVRGYRDNTLGPKAPEKNNASNTSSLGGNVLVEGTFEVLFLCHLSKTSVR